MSAPRITLARLSAKAAGTHRDPQARRGRRGAEPGRHRAEFDHSSLAHALDESLADAS